MKAPVKAPLAGVSAKKGNAPATLQRVANSGNARAMATAALEGEIRETLVQLEKKCVEWQNAPSHDKPKAEMESPAVELFRAKTEQKAVAKQEAESETPQINLPDDEGYAQAMGTIMESVTWSLEGYPVMGDRILEVLQPYVPEGGLAAAVDSPRDPGNDWTMGGAAKGETR